MSGSSTYFSLEAPILSKGMPRAWNGSAFVVACPVPFFPMFNLAVNESIYGVEQPGLEYGIRMSLQVGIIMGLRYELSASLELRPGRPLFTNLHEAKSRVAAGIFR